MDCAGEPTLPPMHDGVRVDVLVEGDMNTAFESLSKLTTLLVGCQDKGMFLQIRFHGTRKKKDETKA